MLPAEQITPAKRTASRSTPAKTVARGAPARRAGTGDSQITVKGEKATAEQRAVIDEALAQAADDGASRRVQIAAVMTMTQESECKRTPHGDAAGADSRGPYQQRAPWGPLSTRMDPGGSTHLFLTGGKGGQPGWKQKHGSLRNAPGNLAAAIQAVQVSDNGSLYAKWEAEATRTVDTWRGASGSLGGDRTIAEPYLFTAGVKDGEGENWWESIGRWAGERSFRRWAALNTLYYVSDRELRAAAPSVEIHGDEPWLLARPTWDWGSVNRPVTEVTLRVLSARWGVLPGAVVLLAGMGPLTGRWLVALARDDLRSPESEVVLRRPVAPAPEPPHETRTASDDADTGSSSSSSAEATAQHISDQGRPYVYGGGHGPALTSIPPDAGLDCSSSCSLLLKRLGKFPGTRAIASGEFAASWGKPGKGRDLTVYANATHVWIEAYNADGSFAWRFDTSPYGDGERGPRLRHTPRTDQARFTARHY